MADNQIGPVGLSNKTLLIGGGVLAVLAIGGVWYVKSKATQAVKYLATDGFNVTSNNNIADNTVNAIAKGTGIIKPINEVTGQENTIGSAFATTSAGKAIFSAGEWLGIF